MLKSVEIPYTFPMQISSSQRLFSGSKGSPLPGSITTADGQTSSVQKNTYPTILGKVNLVTYQIR